MKHPRKRFKGSVITTIATGSVIALALTLGAMNLVLDNEDQMAGFKGTFQNPPEISSIDGVLEAKLTAELKMLNIARQDIEGRVYNKSYAPPVLRVNPGDTIKLRLENNVDGGTNLHYHGMEVSPQVGADNIFIDVSNQPGDNTFDYTIDIPPDHPQGMFWYHPHNVGNSEYQNFSGMSGGIIVEGILDPFKKKVQKSTELVMLLKDIHTAPDGPITGPIEGFPPIPDPGSLIDSNAGTLRTINGQINPTIRLKKGEVQFWRVANVGPDIYYNLNLEGHTLYVIAFDGNRTNQLVPMEEVLLGPSSRVEFFVQGGKRGVYRFRTLQMSTGPDGDNYPEAILATVVVKGSKSGKLPSNDDFPPVQDFRTQPIVNRDDPRPVVFTEDPALSIFQVNGKTFDPDRTDTTVNVGTIESWVITNDSMENHQFHIHQTHFQIAEVNGEPQPFYGYHDTVNIDPGSEVRILIDFRNPVILGRFVYHCHIMQHEDLGMMATILVQDPTVASLGSALPWAESRYLCGYLKQASARRGG